MTARILQQITGKILVVGPVYDKIDKIERIRKIANNYQYVIFNGNLCFPNTDLELVESRIELMNSLLKNRKIIYNMGNQDYLLSHRLYMDNQNSNIYKWLQNKPNVVFAEFKQQTKYIITNGGILKNMNKEMLLDNIETTFVNMVNGKSWHHQYNGMNGYVVSNSPLTEEKPKYYKYSAQIGNIYSPDSQVYAQEIGPLRLHNTILV